MDLNWKLNKTEHIVQDEWIDFRKESFILPDGKEFSPFYNYSRRNFVVIIARTKDDKYITVRQFRHGLKSVTTEFCAVALRVMKKTVHYLQLNVNLKKKQATFQITGNIFIPFPAIRL